MENVNRAPYIIFDFFKDGLKIMHIAGIIFKREQLYKILAKNVNIMMSFK